MLVYFLGLIENKINVIVSAEILLGSTNDITRHDIVNSDYALYNGNMLKIVKIMDEFLNNYTCFHFPYSKIRYNLNGVIYHTIPFYLTKNRAIGANIPHSKFTGQITKWFADGMIEKVINFKNGWKHGHYLENWPNGKIKITSEYVKGNINGEFKKCNKEGKICELIYYINGKIITNNSPIKNNKKKVEEVEVEEVTEIYN